MAMPATWNGAVLVDSGTVRTAGTNISELVHDHARHVHAVAFSVLRDHHDAEDVAQETFLRALRQGESIQQVENHRAWLGRIAWNLSIDKIRDRKHRAQVSIDDEADGSHVRELACKGVNAEHLAQQNQMQQLLARMVASLPEDLRTTLQLSLADGMTSADVAGVLGIPEGTVRTRTMKARQILKEKLAIVMTKRGVR